MQIKIKASKIELTDQLKSYIQDKADMLEKYLGNVKVTNFDVEIAQEVGGQNSGKIYRCEFNVQVPGELLRVEKMAKDIHKSIDKVKDHMARSIERYKNKRIDKKRHHEKLDFEDVVEV